MHSLCPSQLPCQDLNCQVNFMMIIIMTSVTIIKCTVPFITPMPSYPLSCDHRDDHDDYDDNDVPVRTNMSGMMKILIMMIDMCTS